MLHLWRLWVLLGSGTARPEGFRICGGAYVGRA